MEAWAEINHRQNKPQKLGNNKGANVSPKPCHKSWQGREVVPAEKAPLMTPRVVPNSRSTHGVVQRSHRARAEGLLKSRGAAVSTCVPISSPGICGRDGVEESEIPPVDSSSGPASKGHMWVLQRSCA